MWIKILLAFLLIGLVGFLIIMYRKKTTKVFFRRTVVYDESEFYMLLAKYEPEDKNIHKIYSETQHAIVVEKFVIRVGLFNNKFKKVKSYKKYVEYYLP